MNDLSDGGASKAEDVAVATARAVLAADPAVGPVEIHYIGRHEDVRDERFIILMFGGERAFLFDRRAGQSLPLPLDARGAQGDERLPALIESAKTAAKSQKLGKVYFVRHEEIADRGVSVPTPPRRERSDLAALEEILDRKPPR